jgi:DNA-binding PadR family transcriptional regulator
MRQSIHWFVGRHRGGGHSHWSRGFPGDGGLGGPGFGWGRKFASADLQLLILGLLAENPSHGYEIIKALEARSKGFYVPSPGMVYPALTYLEEIGHATIEAAGSRKLYHLTAEGRQYLEEHREAAAALFEQLQRIGERMERVRRVLGADARAQGSAAPPRRPAGELVLARRELKCVLVGKRDASRDEQLRIAEILRRAIADIKKPA